MNANEKAEYAAGLKRSGRCNCCQAVTAALADECGLPEETLMKLASGFAVGMGTMENSCGALIGAAMIAGMKTDGSGTVRYTRQLSDEFTRLSGSVICKELKGRVSPDVFTPCDECVKNAVLAYYTVFGEK